MEARRRRRATAHQGHTYCTHILFTRPPPSIQIKPFSSPLLSSSSFAPVDSTHFLPARVRESQSKPSVMPCVCVYIYTYMYIVYTY
jgi:hypothetical protein